MRTLDEVIKAYEYCIDNNYRDCRGCPYGCEDGESGCHDAEEKKDALHYLKEYQKIEDEYDELKEWWAEEYAENVPLTWDELKLMEGKPVWVKIGGYIGQWSIVHMITPHLFARYYAWPKSPDDPMEALAAELNEENYGKTWQAYRKERK